MSSGALMTTYPQSFERNFLVRLETVINALPPDTSILRTGPEVDSVAFRIFPTNQNSAPIVGQASTQGGIAFKVGRATTVELSRPNEDRFFQICEAVFTSHFTESVIYGSAGRVLYSRIRLEVKGHRIRLGGHQLFWWLFPNRREHQFRYEPYYREI